MDALIQQKDLSASELCSYIFLICHPVRELRGTNRKRDGLIAAEKDAKLALVFHE
jgi:hypothetical protein